MSLIIWTCINSGISSALIQNRNKMQSTLRERYRNRSLSAPGSTTSQEARIVFETALQHAASQQQEQSQQQQSVVVNRTQSSNVSDACTELGQELVTVSTQIGERDSGIKQIITRIVTAVIDQNVDDISVPFFEAIESIINRRMDIDTFVNVMVFCITLVRRYRAASLSTREDKASWVIEQVSELMASAYQRYHIDDWIQEQGGWMGVLRLVRMKYQTFTDYAIREWNFTRRQTATAGSIVIVSAVAFIVWYNW